MWILAIILLVLSLGYLLCLKGRTGHPLMQELRKWKYAHRGLHGNGRPENSMAAFRAALEHGYGIELDVHLMKDGNLAVIHDPSLLRTAGADVFIEDLTVEQLAAYRLENTTEQIPLLKHVLELFDGKAPLIVELKSEKGNFAQLSRATCDLLAEYSGVYCLESFDPRCIRWLRKHRPALVRGQLAENWMGRRHKLPRWIRFVLTYHITNAFTRPDFIAYKYAHRKTFGTGICRKIWGVAGVSWTIRTKQEFDTAVSEGWIPIFENFTP